MTILNKALLTAVAAIGIGMGASASAHDNRPHGRYDERNWHAHHHHAHHVPPQRYVARSPVVITRPVYVAPPARYYAPPRQPGVVISVQIPPLVFALR